MWKYGIAMMVMIAPALGQELDWNGYPDPTRPYQSGAKSTPAKPILDADDTDLRLNFTLVSARQRLAVINGKHYRVGDKIAGFAVRAILPDHVVLQRDGITKTVAATKAVLKPIDDLEPD